MASKRIFIPTMKRINQQFTYNLFNAYIHKNYQPTLVVPPNELKEHKKLGYHAIACPEKGIHRTRQWIMSYAKQNNIRNIMMCDDDVKGIFIRKDPSAFNLRIATDYEIIKLINRMFLNTDKKYAMVGLSIRSGNNRYFPKKVVLCNRLLRFWTVNVRNFFKINGRFDRIELMEDHDVNLQFLENGYPTMMIVDHAHDCIPSNSPGGCSTYRNLKLQEKAAKNLKKLHPNFVRLVIKKSKTAWEDMQERTEVVIQWKKAYEFGKKRSSYD